MRNVLSTKRLQLILTGMILLTGQAFAGDLTKTYTFGSGDPVSSSKINTDFDQLFTEINLKETRIDNIEASSWVTSTRINDGAVTSDKIGSGAVTSTKIADGAVNTADITDDAVTSVKIYDGAVTDTKIADEAVTSAKIADGAVTAAKISGSPDSPPDSPNAFNDEFNSTLDTSTKWTWINQGAGTASTASNYLTLYTPTSGAGNNIRGLVQSVGGTWTITSKFSMAASFANYSTAGILLRESSTGKLIVFGVVFGGGIFYINVIRYNSVTSHNASPYYNYYYGGVGYFRIQNDGTNIKYSVSVDGINFFLLASESKTAFLASEPDQAGLAVNHAEGNPVYLHVDWIRLE